MIINIVLTKEVINAMPPRQYHIRFDAILREKGVICDDTFGDTVHDRLDRNVNRYGANHRVDDDYHDPEAMRDIIDGYVNGLNTIRQETCTDYVRIAYGHIALDYMASKLKKQKNCEYSDLNWKFVFERTWAYYKQRGYDRSYYRYRG